MKFIIIVLILFISCSTVTQKKTDTVLTGYNKALSTVLLDRISPILAKRKTIRLAVISFTPSANSKPSHDRFASYITEEVTSALTGASEGIRLFERNRLDAVAGEHSLSLSGMMNGDDAQRLGNLVPIDYIITGIYIILPSSIRVNGRVINVVSGEIEASVTYDLTLTDDLKNLFIQNTDNQQVPNTYISIDDSCKNAAASLRTLLTNLTTDERKEKLISAAVLIPFDTVCGSIHYSIMSVFEKNKINLQKYRTFLIKTLESIDLPDSDRRALDIISFLSKTGTIEKEEWSAALEIICKSATYHHSYIDYLIYDPFLKTRNLTTATSRIDEIMKLTIDGKVGLPLPVSLDKEFSAILAGCGIYLSDTVPELIVHIFDKHRKSISQKEFISHRDKLEKLIIRKGFEKDRKKILEWIGESYAASKASENSAADMLYFLKMLKNIKADSGSTIKIFTEKYADEIKKIIPAIKVYSQRKEAINICITLKIDVPGFVPEVNELSTLMFSDTPSVQMDAADQLNRYGLKAAPVEKKVLKLLRKSERLNYSGTTNLKWSLIGILGNISSGNNETLDELTKQISSTDFAVPDSAIIALAKTGKKAIPTLKKIFSSSETSIKIKILRIFMLMGNEAASEKSFIENILNTTENDHLRDAAEDAINKISIEH